MRQKFSLLIGPLSVNKTYYGDKRHGMVPEAKEWFANVFYGLSNPEIALKLKSIRDEFDKRVHGIAVRLLWHIPADILYTKAGDLSSRAIDISNGEKSIVDAIFLPRNFGTNVPYQCENLNIDDRYLRRLYSEIVASKDGKYRLDVTIKLIMR
jgi:hypothetical protein